MKRSKLASLIGIIVLLVINNVGVSSGALAGGSVKCGGQRTTAVGTRGWDNMDERWAPRRDVVHGLRGSDSIQTGRGNDLLCGGRGNDVLRGGKGRDILQGGPGKDTYYCGPGNDVAIIDEADEQTYIYGCESVILEFGGSGV